MQPKCFAVLVLLGLAACSDDAPASGLGVGGGGGVPGVGDAAAGVPGAGDTAGAGAGCQSAADCPDGWWCAGEGGCDSVWACVEEVPCSAAAPFFACTCAGQWASMAPGCPAEHYAYTDSVSWQVHEGPCDPEAPFIRHHVLLQGDGFDAWVGHRVLAQAWDSSGAQVASTGFELTGPSFAHAWSDVVHVDGDGVDITMQIDTDANNNCTAGEPSWALHLDNPDDYAQPELTVTIDPTANAPATCP